MEKKITNPVFFDLKKLGLVKNKNLLLINKKTRDKKINVYRDIFSKIIFLEKYTTNINYYKKEKGSPRFKSKSITRFLGGKILKTSKINFGKKKSSNRLNIVGDDYRRFEQFKKYLKNKNICDFGCGYAGFLTLCKKNSKKLFGVEINNYYLNYLNKKKNYIKVCNNIDKFNEKFDVVTLFHVLEHMPNQISALKKIKKKLKKNGKIIVEVPHAKDFLFNQKNNQKFKDFIFWSEHLILHTDKSIKAFLKKAGYKNIKVKFFQRYGFTNHLNWFQNGQPGGHELNKDIYDEKLENFYKKYLENYGYSDTLIAVASI